MLANSFRSTGISFLTSARRGRGAVAVATLAAVGLLTAGCGGSSSASGTAAPVVSSGPSASAAPSISASAAPAATASAGATEPVKSKWGKAVGATGAIRVGNVSLVARSVVPQIKVYRTATDTTAAQTLANPLSSGGPLVFLVQERRAGRLRVLLPIRPNESQGWVSASDVKLAQLDYRITVSARLHQLRLYRAGTLIMTVPVGLGKGTTPTPGGVFYLKELLRPKNPNGSYGPYAYGLSGYSNVLNSFLGGDGEIGLHGTDDPSSVGKDVSHGCIRMRNAEITKLAKMLPLGVPVQMIS